MLFQIYNIEQKSNTEVFLFGKRIFKKQNKIVYAESIETLIVKNIYSDVYFMHSESKKEEFLTDLNNFIKSSGNNTININESNIVSRKNMFIKNLPKNLNLLKINLENISIENFESDYCEMIQTEFTNPVENIVISKKLIGPCIVDLVNYIENKNGNLLTEYNDIKYFKNGDLNNLKICSFAIKSKNDKILSFEYYDGNKIFSINSTDNINIELNNIINEKEPDLIICHNFNLKKHVNIKNRLFCDIFNFAQGTIKGKDFSIEELSHKYNIPTKNYNESVLIYNIFFEMNVLNLAKEMSEISGFMLNKCFSNSRAERIEYTLLHELYKLDYLFPINIHRPISKFSGGLVLEPERGFYEDIILLLDFNSLYPSIIQEFDVCFSTIDEKITDDNLIKDNLNLSENSFLPKILANLVKRRKEVKKLISKNISNSERIILDTRQKVLKLTANSIYGCLGYSNSRFCNFKMAAFITAKGREILKETKIIAESAGMSVIYGDTDSIMIHTKYPGKREYYNQALESVKNIQAQINAKYNHIEIEVECAFSKLLLYTKKKYAGLIFDLKSSHIETKGLEIIRRDYCKASTDLSIKILDIILEDTELLNIESNNKSMAERIYSACLEEYNNLTKKPIEDFIISSVLGKDLSLYGNSNLPHINLAKRLGKKGIIYKQGDVVNYLIGEGSGPISDRGFHPEENFEIDYKYYIKNQLLPPLYRLLSLLKIIHLEKISLIYNVSTSEKQYQQSKSMNFITECCQNVQSDIVDKCQKCQSEIGKEFYIKSIIETLKRACDYYTAGAECIDCGTVYYNHMIQCYYCKKDLKFDIKNREFDELITKLEKIEEFPEITNLVSRISEMSSYRVINLSKYFNQEIENFYREN